MCYSNFRQFGTKQFSLYRVFLFNFKDFKMVRSPGGCGKILYATDDVPFKVHFNALKLLTLHKPGRAAAHLNKYYGPQPSSRKVPRKQQR